MGPQWDFFKINISDTETIKNVAMLMKYLLKENIFWLMSNVSVQTLSISVQGCN